MGLTIESACAIVKPGNDTMDYRTLDLPNGLRVVLVSDPDADKAAVSCDVNVGSLSDPVEFPGLAHFCEHMLFYASEKYPLEDEYSKFISDHGGSTNAWTASENTNYQFDINWEHLEPALDRFAQFFVSPLISADGVDREVNAVDSEHGKNLASDPWRQLQLYKHTANQAHPWSRFATGSRSTLLEGPRAKGLDPRQAVDDFWTHHYSANLMGLAVSSRHSLNEMEAMVRGRFGAVLNRGLKAYEPATDVFLPEHRGQVLKVVPVKDGHSLELSWQAPPSWKSYRAAPLNFLSHLLGHEGNGSVYALLKARGWASSLVAGESGLSISSTSFFYVKVELTDEGHSYVSEVGALVFQYLRLLAESEERWAGIYEEVRGLHHLRFTFRDKPRPYNYVTNLSGMLQRYPDKDLLLAMYHVPQEFRPDLIRESLQCLSLPLVRVCWTSKTFEAEAALAEPVYGTKYSIGPIPSEWMGLWAADGTPAPGLHLPAPNPFIPTDFTLLTEEAAASAGEPCIVVDEPCAMRMHHKCDLTYKTPKAHVLLEVQTPEAYASPECAVMAKLFAGLIDDELSELTYDAELAGLRYQVYSTQAGFVVMVSGYNHKLLVLLEEVLRRVASFQVKEDRMELVREKAIKGYKNMRFQQPYQWAMYRRELLMNLKRWRVEEYLEVAPGITPQQLQDFFKRMMARVHIEGLALGNLSRTEVVSMADKLRGMLREQLGTKPLFPSQMRDLRTVRLPPGTTLLCEPGPNPDNENSAVVIAYQVGPDDVRGNALLQLLVHLCKRDAFNVLRTQQQLGYIVSLHGGQELLVHSVEFIVQSNAFGVAHLVQRIEAFASSMLKELLPAKCAKPAAEVQAQADGGGVEEGAEAGKGDGKAEEEGGDGEQAGEGAAVSSSSSSEFTRAVSELAKSKLEKPKTLGELAAVLWNEVYYGTLIFDRQEREVEQLRSVTPDELCTFAERVLAGSNGENGDSKADAAELPQPLCTRQLVVAVRGSAEVKRAVAAAAAEGGKVLEAGAAGEGASEEAGAVAAAPAVAQSTGGEGSGEGDGGVARALACGVERVQVVEEIAAFKRGCEVFANVAALAMEKRRAAGQKQQHGKGKEAQSVGAGLLPAAPAAAAAAAAAALGSKEEQPAKN